MDHDGLRAHGLNEEHPKRWNLGRSQEALHPQASPVSAGARSPLNVE